MAFTYNVHMRYQVVADDVSKNPIINDAGGLVGLICGPGVLPVTGGPVTVDFYCRASQELLIGNIDSLEVAACGGNSLPMTCTLETFTTESGAMDGVVMTDQTVTVRVQAKWSKVGRADDPTLQTIRVGYYHVDTGGGETFLTSRTFSGLTTGYVNYSGTLTVTQSWAAGEKFRVKYLGKLFGGI